MYTSIPKFEALDVLKAKLSFNNKLNSNKVYEINEITNCVDVIINQNYFSYEKQLYSQNDGFVMGSPLSALLSELYMQNYETQNIFNNEQYKPFILAYFRYVDDTFILFKGSDSQANNFVHGFSKINKNIQFTLEFQLDNKINVLDLTLTLLQNKFSFNIYRKPTQTDAIIPRF